MLSPIKTTGNSENPIEQVLLRLRLVQPTVSLHLEWRVCGRNDFKVFMHLHIELQHICVVQKKFNI